jgi:hypothetical protein
MTHAFAALLPISESKCLIYFFDWKARRDGGTSKKSCEIGAKAPIEPTVSVRGILDNVALEPECRTK